MSEGCSTITNDENPYANNNEVNLTDVKTKASVIDSDNDGDNDEGLLKPNVPAEYRNGAKALARSLMAHPAFSAREEYHWSSKHFEIGLTLGKGSFSTVYLVREKISKYLFAMKVINKWQAKKRKWNQMVIREMEIHRRLTHPNVLQLYSVFHDEENIYFLLEFASGGELFEFMRKQNGNRLSESRAAKYTYQVADAVDYCHKMNVLHRDIKAENILLDCHDNIKLADFGLSVRSISNRRKTVCGTDEYIAPEMRRKEPYSYKVDIWCLGVLCYEMVTGRMPFNVESIKKRSKSIQFRLKFPSHVSEDCQNLISSLLAVDPAARMELNLIKIHSWITQHYVAHPAEAARTAGALANFDMSDAHFE